MFFFIFFSQFTRNDVEKIEYRKLTWLFADDLEVLTLPGRLRLNDGDLVGDDKEDEDEDDEGSNLLAKSL